MPRDDFRAPAVRTLTRRAGHRCSSPDCRRSTSGPDSTPDGTVSIGVAAHITAAAPGGPRYDAELTPTQRSSAANGIWLCQDCATHIDRDVALYTTTLLFGWKAEAEAYAKSLLTVPAVPERPGEPVLEIPSADPGVAWLPFAARVSTFVGRDDEYGALKAFLEAGDTVAWWLVTGPGGSGKSRLALELCLAARPRWNAGFLARVDTPVDWLRFRPNRPTLVVVDYVATRAAETSAMVLQLNRAVAHLPHPVRVLLLERDEGSWSSRFAREDSHTEAAVLAASQHAAPLELRPMAIDDLLSIAVDVARHHGTPMTEASFATRMRSLDPFGRPLFGMLAADAIAADLTDTIGDSGALQRVLRREVARWRQLFDHEDRWRRFQNLLTLATMVGGIPPQSGGFEFLATTEVAALLPDLNLLDPEQYESVAGAHSDVVLPGLQPDILGERFVLDSLVATGVTGSLATRLLDAASTLQPDGVCAFIVRALQDFPGDAAIDVLVASVRRDTAATRVRWGTLVADLVPAVHRSDDRRVKALIVELRALVDAHRDEHLLRAALARAEFNLGNVFLFREGNRPAAVEQYERALAMAEPACELAAAATNNRGIALQDLDDEAGAVADWDNVIGMTTAPAESRACALNNRADVLARNGDHDAAIRDRTAVLALGDTTYNRRYIALSRRSSSYVALARFDDALRDLEQVLITDDISAPQKASAMVDRGLILVGLGRLTEARRDLESVLEEEFVFPGLHADALVGLAEISRLETDTERALEHLNAAVYSPDVNGETVVEALIVRARLFDDLGDSPMAGELWNRVASDPRSNARQREAAQTRITKPA